MVEHAQLDVRHLLQIHPIERLAASASAAAGERRRTEHRCRPALPRSRRCARRAWHCESRIPASPAAAAAASAAPATAKSAAYRRRALRRATRHQRELARYRATRAPRAPTRPWPPATLRIHRPRPTGSMPRDSASPTAPRSADSAATGHSRPRRWRQARLRYPRRTTGHGQNHEANRPTSVHSSHR